METLNALSSRMLQYAVIAHKWASDLEFYKFEIGFLRKLLDRHFFTTKDSANRQHVISINNELLKLEADKMQFELLLNEQIKQLELMAEDVIPEDATALSGKQIKLEYMMTDFFARYRQLKKEIFDLLLSPAVREHPAAPYTYPN
ncbi:MAG: hypothetical protein JST32_07270 [Bacteroidetes bacterium]|nr:hypothetical protein [Bacteroidota bacterium]